MIQPSHKLLNAIESAGVLKLALLDCFLSQLLNFGQVTSVDDLEHIVSIAISETLQGKDMPPAKCLDDERSYLTAEQVEAIIHDASNSYCEAVIALQKLRNERDAARRIARHYARKQGVQTDGVNWPGDEVSNASKEHKQKERETFLTRLK